MKKENFIIHLNVNRVFKLNNKNIINMENFKYFLLIFLNILKIQENLPTKFMTRILLLRVKFICRVQCQCSPIQIIEVMYKHTFFDSFHE
jgi:hypothetical protein